VITLDKISVGIVGCGAMGIIHITNFKKMRNVRQICAYDVSPSRLEKIKKQYKLPVFSNYNRLLEMVDAVCISTPNYLHYRQAMEAIKADKHVLVEKPLSTTSADAWRLVQEAKRHDVILAVGKQKRFNHKYLRLRLDISNGKLGKPVLIRARMFGLGPYRSHKPITDWYYSREKGGGVLFDLGSHIIDLAKWVCPCKVVKVLGVSAGRILNIPVEEYVFCLLATQENIVLSIEVGWFTKSNEESLEVLGTMGQSVARNTQTLKDWALSKFGHVYFRKSDWYWQDQAFINSCIQKTYIWPLARGAEDADCISIIEKIHSFIYKRN
jgi:predicted dehydrogenase